MRATEQQGGEFAMSMVFVARRLTMAAIKGYQRYLSPLKGFRCAYRAHTGRQSCSVIGFRAVRRYGVLAGLAVLRRRMWLCGVAHRRYSQPEHRTFHSQRGFCDVGCDLPCDLPGLDGCGHMPDVSGCGSCDCGSCDWPNRNRRNRDGEQCVYIPPNVDGREGKPT